jgi:valyl-tRNA synthetase
VKVTPAHDRLDYNIAKRHNLPIINVINEEGNMTDACKQYKVLGKSIERHLFIYYYLSLK